MFRTRLFNLFSTHYRKIASRYYSKISKPNFNKLLRDGISYYQNKDNYNAFNNLTQIINDKVDVSIKAIAYLYIYKIQQNGSSLAEWFSIGNLEKSRKFFLQANNKEYECYYIDMQFEYKRIISRYGSLNEYKYNLGLHLKHLGIKPEMDEYP